MNPLFAALPESLQTLSDDQLNELLSGYTATFAAIKKNDPDTLGDRSAQQILEETKAGKDAYAQIKAEQAARADAEATYASEIETLTADIPELETLDSETETEETTAGAETETAEATGAEPEAAADTDAEAVETAETVTAAVRRPPPKPQRQHAPAPVEETDPRLVPLIASYGVPGQTPGAPLTERGLAEALAASINNGTGGRQVVASAKWIDRLPADRVLGEDAARNTEKIAATERFATIETAALVAAVGQGNCAPLTPYYELQVISSQARPVRDSLVGFGAERGGITYMPPMRLADFVDNGAVGVISSADQAAGGTFATKTCDVVVCDNIVSVAVSQVYKCLQFGNLQSRAFPEFVAQQNALAMSEWARLGDTLLLDQIKAGSTHVTGHDVTVQGSVNNYLGDLILAAAGIRSNNRMAEGAPLQAIAPLWLRDELVLDIARGQFDRFDYAQAQIDALLAKYGINMAWTLDGSSDGSQVFGSQSAGALTTFPATVETAIFPPGTWLFLDGGTLDLGIVRDSTLNAINAYQLFAETFEIAAKVGVVSYWLTSTVCPNGAVVLPTSGASYCS